MSGTIRPYTDTLGRAQTAVDGPNGTILITRKSDSDPYEVWRSDSLGTIYRSSSKSIALGMALEAAGVEI